MNRQAQEAGLTLIEILVAMALMGIILQAIFSLQTSTMQASVRLTGEAERLQAIRNANDYFTGRLRSASDVKTSVTVDGDLCELAPTDGGHPCFAIKATEVLDPMSVPIKTATYFMIYQLVPRHDIRPANTTTAITNPLAQDLRIDEWASDPENQVYVLVEKRWRLIPEKVSEPLPATWTSGDPMFVSGSARSSIIADDLAPKDASAATSAQNIVTYDSGAGGASEASSGMKFVTYDLDTKRFDVFLRMKQYQSNRVMYTPADQTFLTSNFFRRN